MSRREPTTADSLKMVAPGQTMASVSRKKRGSVWMDSRPFLPFC